MTRSVIPPCGDQRWFSRRLRAAALYCTLAVDLALVYAVIGWLT